MEKTSCETCGFALWNPVAELPSTVVSLYNDDRFRGRCIVMLNTHAEHLEELDEVTLLAFMKDVQRMVLAIREVTGVERVNVAVLGNTEPHVHAHLIPRYPEQEPHPNKSPWDDTRVKGTFSEAEVDALVTELRAALQS